MSEGLQINLTSLQSYAVLLKFANFLDIVIEVILYGIEIYLMHNLEKQGLGKVGYYNEKERRHKFAERFRNMTLLWLVVTLVGFLTV